MDSERPGIAEVSTGWCHVHFSLVIRFKWRWSHGYFSPATFSLEIRIVGTSWAAALPGECHRGREEQGEFHEYPSKLLGPEFSWSRVRFLSLNSRSQGLTCLGSLIFRHSAQTSFPAYRLRCSCGLGTVLSARGSGVRSHDSFIQGSGLSTSSLLTRMCLQLALAEFVLVSCASWLCQSFLPGVPDPVNSGSFTIQFSCYDSAISLPFSVPSRA